MAFAKQYFSSYKSNNDLDYYLEIWVDGYTGGNPSEISIGAGGPVITYETDLHTHMEPRLGLKCASMIRLADLVQARTGRVSYGSGESLDKTADAIRSRLQI